MWIHVRNEHWAQCELWNNGKVIFSSCIVLKEWILGPGCIIKVKPWKSWNGCERFVAAVCSCGGENIPSHAQVWKDPYAEKGKFRNYLRLIRGSFLAHFPQWGILTPKQEYVLFFVGCQLHYGFFSLPFSPGEAFLQLILQGGLFKIRWIWKLNSVTLFVALARLQFL